MQKRTKILRRALAILEMPLAVVDTTLNQRVEALGKIRSIVADIIRDLDKQMGHGNDVTGGSVGTSGYTPPEPQATPEPEIAAAAPEPEVAAAPEPALEPEAAAAPEAEAPAAPEAEAPAPEPEAPAPEPEVEAVPESVTEEAPALEEPIEGYDKLNVHKISRQIRKASHERLDLIEAYEEVNKNRKTIYQAIARRRERLNDPNYNSDL